MRLLAGLLLIAWSQTAFAGALVLKAADGVSVQAENTGSGDKGIVLVHGEGRSRADWAELAASMGRRGYQVVTLDLRGHGTTGGALDEAAWVNARQDVQAAATWLRSKGCKKVALVGVDVGGAVALSAAAADTGISNLIVLSPRLSAPGIKVGEALAAYGSRPLLLVTGSTDSTGVRAAGALADRATGPHKVEVVTGGSAGTSLFKQSPGLEGVLLSWIATDGNVDVTSAARTTAIETGDATDLETSGTRIGEKPKP